VHFDFEVLLVLAVALSGVIWLIDTLFWRKPREAQKDKQEPVVVEYARSFFPVLLVVLLLRSFLFEPFRIPSGSMMPTLLIGDFILVNKFAYGIRLPVLHTQVTEGDRPKAGDVAVFRYPKDPSLDFIKRVIAVPGDHVAYYNRRLHINGKPLNVEFQQEYEGQGSGRDSMKGARVYLESLGDEPHTMMIDTQVPYSADGELTVPAGQYFVMGDNRDHSNDSRFWGLVPEDHLVGKAFMVWMHWDWRGEGSGLNLGRVGNLL